MLIRRPEKPADLSTPGLVWRPRSRGWLAYWVPRTDIAERGYPVKSAQLWPPSEGEYGPAPTSAEWDAMASRCETMQAEMLAWSNGRTVEWDPKKVYDGTLASAITVYLKDPDSPFAELRYHTARQYERVLEQLKAAIGEALIPALTFRDFKRWHKGFCQPKVEGGKRRVARGHSLMTYVRLVIGFGALLKLAGCKDARDTLSEMDFEMGKRRTQRITAAHAIAIRAEAHRRGRGSIALAQALQFDLGNRQKDAVGEWVPLSEPGISDIFDRAPRSITETAQKWLHGFRWDEVSPDLILTHRLSKSIRGKRGVVDPDAGKVKTYDLKAYRMVMEELALIPPERRVGAMVTDERTGMPWRTKVLQGLWREIATAAGVPKEVQNRDSRAGAITHGRQSGARLEDMRHVAGHTKIEQTAAYDQDDVETGNKVAQLRAKNMPETK